MTKPRNEHDRGGVATEEPLPAYDEGRVDSIHEGEGQSKDPDPRTGEGRPANVDENGGDIVVPKGAESVDAFPSSELADRLGPYNKTTS